VDISNPAAPTSVVVYQTPGYNSAATYAESVDVVGNYAYIACNASGVRVIDITNPGSPSFAGYCTLPGGTGAYAKDVKVSGNYAYVAASSSGLNIVDITNPAVPTYLSCAGAGTLNSASYVSILNNYAYISAPLGTTRFGVVDISNPATPTVSGWIHLTRPGKSFTRFYQYSGISTVYDEELKYVQIIDRPHEFQLSLDSISGFARMIVAGVDIQLAAPLVTSGEWHMITYVHDSDISTGLVYVDGVHTATVAPITFDSFPEFDSTAYTYLGSSGIYTYSGYVSQLGLWNRKLTSDEIYELYYHPETDYLKSFIGYSGNNNLIGYADVYMRSTLRDKFSAASYRYNTSGLVKSMVAPTYESVFGGDKSTSDEEETVFAYVAYGLSGLVILNVSDIPPTFVGSWTESEEVLHQVFVKDNYAYVTSSSYFRIIDVSNKANPTLVGSYDMPNAYGLCVKDNLTYIADLNSGLYIFDVSVPNSPTQIGYCNISGTARSVTVYDEYVYVTDNSSGIKIIDATDPYIPVEIGDYYVDDQAFTHVSDDPFLFVASSYSGMKIISALDPTAPYEMGSCVINDKTTVRAIAKKYPYAYIGDYDYFRVIDIEDFYNISGIANYKMSKEISDIKVLSAKAYVTCFDSGLRILDVSSPTDVTEVACYNNGVQAWCSYILNE
jgi:hypothetical protein